MLFKPKSLFILLFVSIALSSCGSGDNSLIDVADKASEGAVAIFAIIILVLFFVFALISSWIRRNKKKDPPKS